MLRCIYAGSVASQLFRFRPLKLSNNSNLLLDIGWCPLLKYLVGEASYLLLFLQLKVEEFPIFLRHRSYDFS